MNNYLDLEAFRTREYKTLRNSTITVGENRLSAKCEPEKLSKKEHIKDVAEALLFIIPLRIVPVAIAIVLFFIYSRYLVAALFSALLLIYIAFYFLGVWAYKKHPKVYSFTIDEKGITHTDYNGVFHIEWNELASFGFVNNIPTSSSRKREDHQMVAYFSKKIFKKEGLRSKCGGDWASFPLSYSKKKTLVLCFGKNEVDETIMQKIHNLVEKYCVECYRIDLIEELALASDVEL